MVVVLFLNFYRFCLERIEKSNLEIGKMEILYLGKHYPKMFRQKRKKYKGKYSKIMHVELICNINLGDWIWIEANFQISIFSSYCIIRKMVRTLETFVTRNLCYARSKLSQIPKINLAWWDHLMFGICFKITQWKGWREVSRRMD